MPKITNQTSGRPTLPSIHTLNLPLLSRPSQPNLKYEHYDNLRRSPHYAIRHERHVSSSSSNTSVSHSTSPSPGNYTDTDSDTDTPVTSVPSSLSPGSKLRLRPCLMEDADAIVVIAWPEQMAAQPSDYSSKQAKGRGVVLVGPAIEKFRNPQRPLPKNTRVHPYRIVRGPPTPGRRSSVISITAHHCNPNFV